MTGGCSLSEVASFHLSQKDRVKPLASLATSSLEASSHLHYAMHHIHEVYQAVIREDVHEKKRRRKPAVICGNLHVHEKKHRDLVLAIICGPNAIAYPSAGIADSFCLFSQGWNL